MIKFELNVKIKTEIGTSLDFDDDNITIERKSECTKFLHRIEILALYNDDGKFYGYDVAKIIVESIDLMK